MVKGATLCNGTITDCVAWLPCRFAAINSIPSNSGRFRTTDPSVGIHGSSTTISRASPICNTDGPSANVDCFGVQSGVGVGVAAAAPPERSGTVNVPPLTITLEV